MSRNYLFYFVWPVDLQFLEGICFVEGLFDKIYRIEYVDVIEDERDNNISVIHRICHENSHCSLSLHIEAKALLLLRIPSQYTLQENELPSSESIW